MKKYVKMALYADPGVGKSTFASKAPNPFFLCTDGNFCWLGLPEENHVEVQSWEDCKKAFKLLSTPEYDWVQTVVVDLTEDMFKWCEQEYCKKNKLDHIGDQGFGKGYDITRNDFFIEIGKLINLSKHVLLLMHGITKVEKDRRGVEHTKFFPSSRIPDKLLDMIEGRMRYFLRAYTKAEEDEDGKLIKKRYLSIVPKENEFGISRGIDEDITPYDIDLDWNVFASVIGLDEEEIQVNASSKKLMDLNKIEDKKPSINTVKSNIIKPTIKTTETPKVETKVVETKVVEEKVVETKEVETKEVEEKVVATPKVEPKVVEEKIKEVVKEDLPQKEEKVVEASKVEETKEEVKKTPKQLMEERIAAIKAQAAKQKK